MGLINPVRIEGRKGGGGGSAPTESSDTLRSIQVAEVLDLICEGPVQGLVNGLKSIYLDGSPLVSPTGESNFQDVTYAGTIGTQGQAALHGFDLLQQEIAVGVKVLAAVPVVRTVTSPDVDTVRVTIGVPQLSFQDPVNGDLKGNTLEYMIELQSNGGGYVQVYHTTIDGKSMSRYQRATTIELTGSPPWDLRVTRLTPDTSTSNDVRDLWWDSYTEITTARLRYPNSALCGLRVNARQFNRIPVRGYDMLLKVIQVPSNYDPLARTYTGVWDGTFVPAWSNNPAWVFYDLVTHPRYGLGEYIAATALNKWKLYTLAQYCDQLVPDGRGGQEPRFTCNCYLQTQQDAYKLLQDIAGLFRCMVFYGNGLVDVSQDAPSDAVSLFTPANVVDGRFVYQGASERTRHSGVIVYWNNLSNQGKREPELYQHPELVQRYGVRNLELSPIGTWSRGEAVRLAKWALYSEEFEGELVTFTVGTEGALVPMGRVFKIADPSVAGLRLGGRVREATTTAVTLDKEVTLEAGHAYTVTVSLPDAADPFNIVSQTRDVTTAAGVVSVLDVSVAFDAAPPAQAIWILESTEVAATTWRCLGIREVAGKKNQFEITGIAHNPTKYGFIEDGLLLERKPVSVTSVNAPTPIALSITETVYHSGPMTKSRITISWTPPAPALLYRVTWRYASGVWQQIPDTSAQTVEISDLEPGELDVVVRAVNSIGNISPPLTDSYTVTGKTTGPAPVTALTATGIEHGIRIKGTLPPDLDLAYVELWEGTDAVLAHAIKYTQGLADTYDRLGLSGADGVRYYWVCPFDTSGNPGDFTGPVNATAGITAVPGSVTGLTATGIEHGIRIKGTLPADLDLAYLELWEGTDNVLAHATKYTQGFADTYDRLDLSGAAGLRYYWARCVNTSGTPGAFVGPVSAVAGITAVPGTVTALTATSIIGGIRITGTLPADQDLASVLLYENTVNNSASATLLTSGLSDHYDRLGLLPANGIRYYWAKCMNTSGTPGPFSAVASASAGQAVASQIASVSWSTVGGAGRPDDDADVTTSILSSSGTSIVMTNANLFKSGSGLGGVFIGSGGLFGKNSGGVETFAIDATTGAVRFKGDLTGATGTFSGNLSVSGQAVIDGTYTSGGFAAALHVNPTFSAPYGIVTRSDSSVGRALAGIGTSGATGVYGSTTSGMGVHGYITGSSSGSAAVLGESGNASSYGVRAIGFGAGVALGVEGKLSVNNSTLTWNGYSYAAPAGSSTTVLHNDGVWRDPVTTARVNAAFGASASSFALAGHDHAAFQANGINVFNITTSARGAQYSADGGATWVTIQLRYT